MRVAASRLQFVMQARLSRGIRTQPHNPALARAVDRCAIQKTNMKKLFLTIFISSFGLIAKCDIIFNPLYLSPLSYSIEGIIEYERPLSEFKTINYWGGVGFVGNAFEPKYPAFGIELGIEKRKYFKSNYKGLNFDLYFGTAFMISRDFHFGPINRYGKFLGFIPGIKITQKSLISNNFVLEPYISFSIPFYSRLDDRIFPRFYPCLTIGTRIGISILK